MIRKAKTVFEMFDVSGNVKRIEKMKSGIINDTFHVMTERDGRIKEYTLQRINGNVFKNPAQTIDNIERITLHLKMKMEARGQETENRLLTPIHLKSGENFFRDEIGSFWRLYPYIDKSVCYNTVDTPEIMKMIGKAFGEFQYLLADFPAETLYTTIPDFHNTKKRFFSLYDAWRENSAGRANAATGALLGALKEKEKLAFKLQNMLEAGELPLRVTHNDTKSNNVLLDEITSEPVSVIDLDTVMPGLSVHDFGDAVRYGANTGAEDEVNLSKVSLDLEMYEAFAAGFIPELENGLSDVELENMSLGAITMTLELAARFLTDYLNGDVYFKTKYPEHNLVRTKAQLTLAEDMIEKFDKMQAIINKYRK